MQSQLRFSHRNFYIYRQISRDLCKKWYDQHTVQYRVKIKKLRQVYQAVREENRGSGVAPKTCQFYKELDAFLGDDPTSTTKNLMDTSVSLEAAAERGPNPEDKIVDEEVELDNDFEPMAGHPVGKAARNCSPLQRRLASLSSCSLANKKQERRHRERGLCSAELGSGYRNIQGLLCFCALDTSLCT